MNEKQTHIDLTNYAYNKIVNDLRTMTVCINTPEYCENRQVAILCTTNGKKLWIHNQEPCIFEFEYLNESISVHEIYCITEWFEFPVNLPKLVRIYQGDKLKFDRGELLIEMELTLD